MASIGSIRSLSISVNMSVDSSTATSGALPALAAVIALTIES